MINIRGSWRQVRMIEVGSEGDRSIRNVGWPKARVFKRSGGTVRLPSKVMLVMSPRTMVELTLVLGAGNITGAVILVRFNASYINTVNIKHTENKKGKRGRDRQAVRESMTVVSL